MTTSSELNQLYDGVMWHPLTEEFFRHSDFFNWGYWDDGCVDPVAACEALVDRLLALLPERGVGGATPILDVGCGKGAVARHLLRYHSPEAITGINVSARQLEVCRHNAPGCDFRLMDAARLEFQDRTFGTVLCVESAFHFRTRERFLRQAYQVLRPGGRLLLTDILNDPGWQSKFVEPANDLVGPAEYRELLEYMGFSEVRVLDEIKRCAAGHLWSWQAFLRDKRDAGALTAAIYEVMVRGVEARLRAVRHYLVVGARRPAADRIGDSTAANASSTAV